MKEKAACCSRRSDKNGIGLVAMGKMLRMVG